MLHCLEEMKLPVPISPLHESTVLRGDLASSDSSNSSWSMVIQSLGKTALIMLLMKARMSPGERSRNIFFFPTPNHQCVLSQEAPTRGNLMEIEEETSLGFFNTPPKAHSIDTTPPEILQKSRDFKLPSSERFLT